MCVPIMGHILSPDPLIISPLSSTGTQRTTANAHICLALEDLPVGEFEKSEDFDEHHQGSGNQKEMHAFFEDR